MPDRSTMCSAADDHLVAGRPEQAIPLYLRALEAGDHAAWHGLGCARLAQRAYGAAAAALQQAVARAPDPERRCQLGSALFQLGRVDDAIAQFRPGMSPEMPEVASMAAGTIACIIPGASVDHAEVLAARRAWLSGLPVPTPAKAPRPPGDKLRIGYMSAFFGDRNWMKPVWGVINNHDRSRFELHMFSDGTDPSADSGYREHDTDRIYSIDGLRGLDNAGLASLIAEVGIDVLVDLNGYSFQDRLPVPLSRPAPVVVGWFNMFATTGSTAFDWLVGDASVIRQEEEAFYPERIYRVPGSYLAFDVTYATPDIGPPPSVQNGFLTFGCLGSQYKLTDAVLAAWATILRAAPGSRLLLRNAALSDPSTRDDLSARLGVEPSRLALLGRAPHEEFLATYARIDVALDTFPYNGGTTTSEALWQGVPVLSFDGDRWASRTSRSLLLAAGLSDWVMPGLDGYVARAIELASDPATPARLAGLRAGFRDRLRASAACDTAGLCRALEEFYATVSA